MLLTRLNGLSQSPGGLGISRSGIVVGLLLLLACASLALDANMDLAVARIFYADGRFIADAGLGRAARMLARVTPFVLLAGLTFAWAIARLRKSHFPAPSGRSLVWLLVSLALGPGLIVDGLKDISHRPRPVQVTEFGGTQAFRPFYRFDGSCPRNCSFPSGETAAAFWTLAPASLAPPPVRPLAIGAAFLFGTSTAMLRMAFGGHFASDVIFAAIVTIAVLFGLQRTRWLRAAGRPRPARREQDSDFELSD
jgi:lipid A 4'-phosphatase